MKIILETKEDLEEIIQYEELDNKEIIIQNELSQYLVNQKKLDYDLTLEEKEYFKSNNVINDLIVAEIDNNMFPYEKVDLNQSNVLEMKKAIINTLKYELENLNLKQNISAEDIARTDLLFKIYQHYQFMHPKNINKVISKLEKDLAEIES